MKKEWEKFLTRSLNKWDISNKIGLFRDMGYTADELDFHYPFGVTISEKDGQIYKGVELRDLNALHKSEMRRVFMFLVEKYDMSKRDFDEHDQKLLDQYLEKNPLKKPMTKKQWNKFLKDKEKEKKKLIAEIKRESNENKRKNQAFGYGQKNISVKDVIDDIMELQNNKKPRGRTQTTKEILDQVGEAGEILEKMLGKDRLDAIMDSIDKEAKA
tara:strand:+ start:355 stop:996 length:642 start_codon:yes stop_codon:yes gene_type:complete